MSADQLIYDTLEASSVSGMVSRIYMGRVTNDFTYPILQLRQIGGNAVPVFEGEADLQNPSYQMDVYAKTQAEANQIDDAARDALINANTTGFKALRTTLPFIEYDEETNEYRLTNTLSIWYGG